MKLLWFSIGCLLLSIVALVAALTASQSVQSRASAAENAAAAEMEAASKAFYEALGDEIVIDRDDPKQAAAGAKYRDAVSNYVAKASTPASLYPIGKRCLEFKMVHWSDKFECHVEMVRAAHQMVPKSHASAELDDLLLDFMGPVIRVHGGPDVGNAISEHGLLEELYARFAIERAAILTNAPCRFGPRRRLRGRARSIGCPTRAWQLTFPVAG